MDLALHFRVLSRHKALLIGGLLVAALLAVFSYVSVGPGGISYRHQEKWQSVTRLFAAQSGYPFKPGLRELRGRPHDVRRADGGIRGQRRGSSPPASAGD